MNATAQRIRFPYDTPPAPGTAREIAEGLLWIRFPLPMRLDHVNLYALDDGEGWTIVDTGFSSKRGIALWEGLLAGPLAGRPVSRILLTHHHPDHVGMAGWLRARFGAEIWATRTAWLMARMLTLDVQDALTPEALSFYIRAGMDPRLLEERKTSRPYNFADTVQPIPLGFRRIAQGQRLQIGGRTWRVEIGHGHAPEHATLWSEDGQFILAGDQILPGISPNLGVYPTEPDADTVGDWMDSCTRLRGLKDSGALVLPGHKLPFTGVHKRLDQLIDNHHHALERLRAHLLQPRRAAECFIPLFKRQISDGDYGLALAETVGHLNHLSARGEVTRSLSADGAFIWRMAPPIR